MAARIQHGYRKYKHRKANPVVPTTKIRRASNMANVSKIHAFIYRLSCYYYQLGILKTRLLTKFLFLSGGGCQQAQAGQRLDGSRTHGAAADERHRQPVRIHRCKLHNY